MKCVDLIARAQCNDVQHTCALTCACDLLQPIARKHVLIFEYKVPFEGFSSNPTLQPVGRGAGALVHKAVYDNKHVNQHHVRHHICQWSTAVMSEGQATCRFSVLGGYEFDWDRDWHLHRFAAYPYIWTHSVVLCKLGVTSV